MNFRSIMIYVYISWYMLLTYITGIFVWTLHDDHRSCRYILQSGCVTRTRIVWTEEYVRKILWLIHTIVPADRVSPAVTVNLVSTVHDLEPLFYPNVKENATF